MQTCYINIFIRLPKSNRIFYRLRKFVYETTEYNTLYAAYYVTCDFMCTPPSKLKTSEIIYLTHVLYYKNILFQASSVLHVPIQGSGLQLYCFFLKVTEQLPENSIKIIQCLTLILWRSVFYYFSKLSMQLVIHITRNEV